QAMPSGGLLSIAGAVKDGSVVLEVTDTGAGIPEHDQRRIFDPNYTTKSGHVGLGLPLVRVLVRQMEGEITVASRPGKGATFSLTFPVAEFGESLEPSVKGRRRGTPVF
ncbi:MAG: ATP-binding protein, partial [Acidobacteria bacterium]|nr:ATP-binding protein [Acidobacteriota bacterium]